MVRSMKEHEREFLIAEYEQAWAMILNIDERRFKFVEYYSAVFTAIIAVGTGVIVQRGGIDADIATALSVLLAVGAMVGQTFRGMLRSERAANLRYRKKINLLRTVFLGDSDHGAIQDFVNNHKEIGILLADDAQPSGTGSTLPNVFRFLTLETAVLVLAIPLLWTAVLLGW